MKKLGLVILLFCFGFLPALAAEIQVAVPSANASWKIDTTKTIQWTFSGIDAAAKVRIVLWQGGTKIGIVANQLAIGAGGQGSFNWKVGSVLDAPQPAPGSGYSIKVRTVDDTASGQSGMFSMIRDTPILNTQSSNPGSDLQYAKKTKPPLPGVNNAPLILIQVTQPEANQDLAPYGDFPIHWKTVGIPDANVAITLLRDGQPEAVLAGSTPNPGEFIWHIGSQPPAPGTYKVAVETLDKKHRGKSGAFTVQENGTVNILLPLPGAAIPNGSSQEIKWTLKGNIQKVDIVLVRNDTGHSDTMATGVNAAAGTITRVFSTAQSGLYHISIKNSSSGNGLATSGNFLIVGDQ